MTYREKMEEIRRLTRNAAIHMNEAYEELKSARLLALESDKTLASWIGLGQVGLSNAFADMSRGGVDLKNK